MVGGFLVLATVLPVLTALGEDAGEKLRSIFEFRVRSSALTGEFGFGGDEAAFAGDFEDGGAVAFEVGLHPPQRRHPRLQPRELLLYLRHDSPLFDFERNEQWNPLHRSLRKFQPRSPADVWAVIQIVLVGRVETN